MEIEGMEGIKFNKVKNIDYLFNDKKEIGNEGCWTLSSAK